MHLWACGVLWPGVLIHLGQWGRFWRAPLNLSLR